MSPLSALCGERRHLERRVRGTLLDPRTASDHTGPPVTSDVNDRGRFDRDQRSARASHIQNALRRVPEQHDCAVPAGTGCYDGHEMCGEVTTSRRVRPAHVRTLERVPILVEQCHVVRHPIAGQADAPAHRDARRVPDGRPRPEDPTGTASSAHGPSGLTRHHRPRVTNSHLCVQCWCGPATLGRLPSSDSGASRTAAAAWTGAGEGLPPIEPACREAVSPQPPSTT